MIFKWGRRKDTVFIVTAYPAKRSHTEVEFAVKGNTVVLRRTGKLSRRGRRLLTLMRGKATARLTTDQIMALTRG